MMLLLKLGRARYPREAYDAAEPIAELLIESNTVGSELEIANYLVSQKELWQDVLLSCFADNDVPLNSGPLRTAILSLVNQANSSLSQSAVLAMYAGGIEARQTLIDMLAKHGTPDHIEGLLKLVE